MEFPGHNQHIAHSSGREFRTTNHSSTLSMWKDGTKKYSIHTFLALGMSIWVPVLLLSALLLTHLESNFDYKEALMYMNMQTLAIGHSRHVTTTDAVAVSAALGTLLVPFSVFISIVYATWWLRLLKRANPIFSLFVIWFSTAALNFVFIAGETILDRIYNIYNFFTTNGYIVTGELKWYVVPIFIHASLIYTGTLYLTLEVLVNSLENFTETAAKKIRRTIIPRADRIRRIMTEIEELSNDQLTEVLEHTQTISSSRHNSIRSFRHQSMRSNRASRIPRVSKLSIVNLKGKRAPPSPVIRLSGLLQSKVNCEPSTPLSQDDENAKLTTENIVRKSMRFSSLIEAVPIEKEIM